jgi:modulator of FtsH protease HflC
VRRSLIIGVAAILVIALLSFTMTYTVRFTEAAVLTTFGKAGPDAVRKEPGLEFKWPYPFQSVTTYDTRIRIVQMRSETQQTNDSRQLIVEAFVTWRVADPLVFFQRYSNAGERADDHYRRAEEILQDSLRSAMSEISRYRMGDLFPKAEAASKLPELEQAILQALRQGAGEGGRTIADDGIEAVDVGVSRIKFPEETTKAVFDRMASDRKRLVAQIQSQGVSQAQTIRTQADNLAKKIQSFADARAKEIRAVGDVEATKYLKLMDENPELAVFLRNLDFIRNIVAKRTTLVLSNSTPGLNLLSHDALDGITAGQIPGAAKPKEVSGAPARPSDTEPRASTHAEGAEGDGR